MYPGSGHFVHPAWQKYLWRCQRIRAKTKRALQTNVLNWILELRMFESTTRPIQVTVCSVYGCGNHLLLSVMRRQRSMEEPQKSRPAISAGLRAKQNCICMESYFTFSFLQIKWHKPDVLHSYLYMYVQCYSMHVINNPVNLKKKKRHCITLNL